MPTTPCHPPRIEPFYTVPYQKVAAMFDPDGGAT